jgi:hypothetical protein
MNFTTRMGMMMTTTTTTTLTAFQERKAEITTITVVTFIPRKITVMNTALERTKALTTTMEGRRDAMNPSQNQNPCQSHFRSHLLNQVPHPQLALSQLD